MNPARVGYIRDAVEEHYGLTNTSSSSSSRTTTDNDPFTGLRFLDIGCGGGILSEVRLHRAICMLIQY